MEKTTLKVARYGTSKEAPVLTVSATSRPITVAQALVDLMRSHGTAEVHAVGAGAVNKVSRALAIARCHLENDGIKLAYVPQLVTVDVDGSDQTVLWISVDTYASASR